MRLGVMLLTGCMSLQAWAGPEVTFDVTLVPAGDFKGKTNEVTGKAIVEGNKVRAEDIRVKLANVKTGVELRDEHTRKHLQADQYPEAILIRASGENGQGTGILKIKNIEKEVKGTYKIEGQELAAQFQVKLSDYDIKGIKYMGVGVDDEVILKVRVPTMAATAAPAVPTKAAAPAAPTKPAAPSKSAPAKANPPAKKGATNTTAPGKVGAPSKKVTAAPAKAAGVRKPASKAAVKKTKTTN